MNIIKKKPQCLPQGVRGIIYSFIDLMTLIKQMKNLSMSENKFIRHSEVLDQERNLKIHTGLLHNLNDIEDL